jgi:hypothetical protein
MDNAHPHNSGRDQRCIEASRDEHLPHPVYRPDPAPSDFFLFGYIKGKQYGHNSEDREDLLTAITEIFIGVNQEVLLSVFKSRANRLKWVIKSRGCVTLSKE